MAQHKSAGIEIGRPGRLVLVPTPFLWRPRKYLLAGLELPGGEAVYRLADKRRGGVVAERVKIICELP